MQQLRCPKDGDPVVAHEEFRRFTCLKCHSTYGLNGMGDLEEFDWSKACHQAPPGTRMTEHDEHLNVRLEGPKPRPKKPDESPLFDLEDYTVRD